MHKKSQGLSVSVIILAALGLMVLIIMVLIFTGQVNIFSKNIGCTARGGECMALESGRTCDSDRPIIIYTQDCPQVGGPEAGKKPGQCCMPIG